MAPLGKSLIVLGVMLAALGLVLWGASSVPILSRVGRLPGDIYVRRGNLTLYFPITTAILASIALSLIFAWLRR
jgi:Protein of unknown function (DUF2905)